jgi:release factor glutamine methyltransferase
MNQNDWLLQPLNNSIGRWLEEARRQLEKVSESPALESQMVMSYIVCQPRSWVIAHPEFVLSESVTERLNDCLKSVVDGYPFAYITGMREFFGRQFELRPGLLVPRPETELLVEFAVDWLRVRPAMRSAVDVGCGSGPIAVTLAAEISDLHIEAIDIDPLAVQVTTLNAVKHGVSQHVHAFKGDLLSSVQTSFKLICANLPYIPSETVLHLPASRHEPVLALDGGPDGLRLIDTLLEQSTRRLNPGGLILLEIEASQGESAPELASHHFPQSDINLHCDLAGHPRLVSIQN